VVPLKSAKRFYVDNGPSFLKVMYELWHKHIRNMGLAPEIQGCIYRRFVMKDLRRQSAKCKEALFGVSSFGLEIGRCGSPGRHCHDGDKPYTQPLLLNFSRGGIRTEAKSC
jgi:hypothetical protein